MLDRLDPRIAVPSYDRATLGGGLVHIGVGGFHRAHQAEYLDDLCNAGLTGWSITGAGVMPQDSAMAEALTAQDGLYTLVTRSQEGTGVRIVGTIVDYVLAVDDQTPLVARLADPATRIVSLTITEGGYPVDIATGAMVGSSPVFESIARALSLRRAAGQPPFTVMSCDNILHNGRVAQAATVAAGERIGSDLAAWIEGNVAFPSTMVDRITPVTEQADRQWLRSEFGLVDRWPVVAESFRQWVVEDRFSDGRPPWEDAGVLVTDDVEPYELLKLRLLNAGHSTLAYLAALAGYQLVDEVMEAAPFSAYLRRFLDDEAGAVLPPVGGVDVTEYKQQIVQRFSNPAIRDQVSRLCLDGSSKFPVFLMPTIQRQLEVDGPVRLAALALAGWCQYLLGKDDAGTAIELAADPRLDTAVRHAEASLADPVAFLGFASVFPSFIAENERFRNSFVRALGSIREIGAMATVTEAVRAER